MQDKRQELIQKLEEIFQFPNEDLDFGIYKVYKYKREYIKKFLYGSNDENIKSIDQIIEEVFGELKSVSLTKLEKDLEEVKKEIIENLGEEALDDKEILNKTKLGRKYLQLKEEYEKQKEKSKLSEDIKINIYNHLYNFFSKYYKDGDFIPLRRWGEDKHIVFYNGQEVFFYWATKNMYYIKSGEIFKEYSFKVDNKIKVSFKVVDIQDTKGNQKTDEKRYFFFKDLDKKSLDEIVIYFEYRALKEEEKEKYGKGDKVQSNINEETKQILEEKLKRDFPLFFRKENDEEILFKHLRKFTHKNKFDFFIHENLRDFLLKELDFYIKNSVLYLENLDDFDELFSNAKFYIKEAQVIYKIAKEIIEFLSILENFQKKLWKKPKFVIDTHYVITLDRLKEFLDEEDFNNLLDEVLYNEKQIREWINLGFFEEDENINKESLFIKGSEPLFERSIKPLPIDTKNFNEGFKWKLLNILSNNEKFNLDEALDGILIKSDNYQALNLLKHKFKDSVKTVYIDPPYNTGNDGFLYKDSYRHSSWLSMMENRLEVAKELMSEDGAIFVNIDNNEIKNALFLLDILFRKENFIENIIWRKKSGGGQQDEYLVTEHDYILLYAKDKAKFKVIDKEIPVKENEYKYYDKAKKRKYKRVKLAKWGSGSYKEDRPTMFFPLIAPDGSKVYPKAPDGKEGRWRYGKSKIEEMLKNDDIDWEKANEEWIAYEKVYLPESKKAKIRSIFYDVSENSEGANELKYLFSRRNIYTTPKPSDLIFELIYISSNPNSIILDFFAGSGTTAHAVMKLNAEDGGKRKFILVEMADYFDTVIIPRIKKVAYSFNWKEGKPQDTDGKGIFFKYHTLEQYEDTLENIDFIKTDAKLPTKPLQQNFINLKSNHIIKYKLDIQAQNLLNIQAFENIEDYKIKILDTKNTQKSDYKKVDIIETFIYLSGIKVEKLKKDKNHTLIIGKQNNIKTLAVFQNTTNKTPQEISKDISNLIKTYKPDQFYINNLSKTPILNSDIQVKSIENLFMEKMQ